MPKKVDNKDENNEEFSDPWDQGFSSFDPEEGFSDNFNSDGEFPSDTNEDFGLRAEDVSPVKIKDTPPGELAIENPLTKVPLNFATCGILGLFNFGSGFLVGSLFGSIQGVIHGYSGGFIGQPGFMKALGLTTAASGFSLGSWLGSYTLSKCMIAGIRKKNDRFNSFGGGFLAGCLGTLRSRSPRMIVASGLGSGVLMAILDGDSFKI